MGTWLLWYATYHYQIHVHQISEGFEKSAKIGITWTLLIVFFATLIGVIGRLFLGFDESINENSLVFIQIVRKIFPGVISGILLSAVLAASMSTADSQLLAASSAFSSDVYKPVIRKGKANDKEMMWTGRIVVLGISVAALIIASNPNAGSIMALVSNAWGYLWSCLWTCNHAQPLLEAL